MNNGINQFLEQDLLTTITLPATALLGAKALMCGTGAGRRGWRVPAIAVRIEMPASRPARHGRPFGAVGRLNVAIVSESGLVGSVAPPRILEQGARAVEPGQSPLGNLAVRPGYPRKYLQV